MSSFHSVDPGASGDGPLSIAVLYSRLTMHGGGERQVLEDARWLRRLGHRVTVFTFELSDEAVYDETLGAESIRVLQATGPLRRMLLLRRELRTGGFDVFIAHTSAELIALALRGCSIPFLCVFNEPFFFPYNNKTMLCNRYRRRFAQVRDAFAGYDDVEISARPNLRPMPEIRAALRDWTFRHASAVILVSDVTRRELELLHGVRGEVIRGCLPPALVERTRRNASPKPAGRGPDILSVCRLDPMKRLDVLIRAFAQVRGKLGKGTLTLVGTGPERDKLEAVVGSLGLTNAVRFEGYVRDADLWKYYRAADVYVTPALADFNIAPYEALALGCPVVWTNEMETEQDLESTGWVFAAPPTPGAFADAILRALEAARSDPPDLTQMTWEARSRRIAALCRQAVGPFRPRTVAAVSEALPS